jgi:phage-related protein
MVAAMQTEMRLSSLEPARVSELLGKATALIGNCADEMRDADVHYNIVLLRYLDADEAANRARIRAETSPEYQRKRQAKDTKELVVEMVRSLKEISRAKREEMQLTR